MPCMLARLPVAARRLGNTSWRQPIGERPTITVRLLLGWWIDHEQRRSIRTSKVM